MGLQDAIRMPSADYPFRHLITPEERTHLSTAQPRRVLVDIALLWLQIVLAWALASWLATPLGYGLAMLVIGNRYYALFIIGHDGLHRRIHPDVSKNDLINDLLVLGPICAITRINRLNHMQHHQTLGFSSDPDRFKYAHRNDLSSAALLLSFTGIPLVLRAAVNVFARKPTALPVERPKYRARDIAIITIWQAALLGGLTLVFGWWGYFVMWMLPVAALTVAFDLLRVFCEHSVENDTPQTGTAERLIMVDSFILERMVFSPMNMNHHVAHHTWPSIPYFNLPEATRLIESRAVSAGLTLIRRDGYVSYLARCLKDSLRRRTSKGIA